VRELAALGTQCTAGPMLIERNETYMLTAGHCFGAAGRANVTVKTSAEYPRAAGQREIGKEGMWYETETQDFAEVRIVPNAAGGAFAAALPTPVPALMAEWGSRTPETPHAVEGEEAPREGEMVCHEGMTSGELGCGSILRVNVTFGGRRGIVETDACSEGGDSGGPWFFRTRTGGILMEGTHIGKPEGAGGCPRILRSISFFEPLSGILATFAPQQLLTTRNEVRGVVGALPLTGESFPIVFSSLPADSPNNGIKTEFQNAAGTLKGAGFTLKGEIANSIGGEYEASFLSVEEPTSREKCNTAGDGAGEVLAPKGSFKFVHDINEREGLGTLFEVKEFEVTCGVAKIKLRGNALGLLKPIGREILWLGGEGELHCGKLVGEPAETKYWVGSSGETAQLLANFGAGFRKSCEEVVATPLKIDFSKMIELMQ
jgi:hypothetical protein